MFGSGSEPVWPWTKPTDPEPMGWFRVSVGLVQGPENSLNQTKGLGHSSQKFVVTQTNLNCGITITEY